MTRHGIDLESDAIRDFCRRWKIIEMDVFGSILRDDFRPDSDVDFLVSYAPGVRWTFRESIRMEEELAGIVGRRVDIVERAQLEDSEANPYRRSHILRHKERIHVGG